MRGSSARRQQAELVQRPSAIQDDEGGRPLTQDPELLEICQVAQPVLSTHPEDDLRRPRADAGDPQQLETIRQVEIHRGMSQGGFGVCLLRVDVEGKPARLTEGHFLEIKAIVAKQVGGFIQPLLPERVFGWMVLQRCLFDRCEGLEIGSRQTNGAGEVGHCLEDLKVALSGSPDDELCAGRRPATTPSPIRRQRLADLFHP